MPKKQYDTGTNPPCRCNGRAAANHTTGFVASNLRLPKAGCGQEETRPHEDPPNIKHDASSPHTFLRATILFASNPHSRASFQFPPPFLIAHSFCLQARYTAQRKKGCLPCAGVGRSQKLTLTRIRVYGKARTQFNTNHAFAT